MVQFRDIKSAVFREAGFSSKKDAIAFLAAKGQTGHKFETSEAVVEYLKANHKKAELEDLPEEVKDEEREAKAASMKMADLCLSESENEYVEGPTKKKNLPKKAPRKKRKPRKAKTAVEKIPVAELHDPTAEVPESQVMSD